MRGVLQITIAAAGFCLLGAAQSSAQAPETFEFTFSEAGGTAILDNTVRSYQIDVGETMPLVVQKLEFEITGLTHSAPMDLFFALLGPAGDGIKLMDEAGGMGAISGVNLVFNDTGMTLPSGSDEFMLGTGGSGDFLPAGPPPDGFSQFNGRDATGLWTLIVIDDAAGDQGSFDSFTLRVTVPEPATISLLALGAIAAIRRRFRRVA